MRNFLSTRAFKILVILLLSCGVLLGFLVTSIPAALKKKLVLGGDYAFGEGTTSVKSAAFTGFNEIRVKDVAFRNPSSPVAGDLLNIKDITVHIRADQWFTSSKKVRVDVDRVELKVDASIEDHKLQLNLIDAFRKLKDGFSNIEDSSAEWGDPDQGTQVRIAGLQIKETIITGEIRLPGRKAQPISIEIPRITAVNEAGWVVLGFSAVEVNKQLSVGELYQVVMQLVFERALTRIIVDSQEWELTQGERTALIFVLASWSGTFERAWIRQKNLWGVENSSGR